jgi:hypothetical protein
MMIIIIITEFSYLKYYNALPEPLWSLLRCLFGSFKLFQQLTLCKDYECCRNYFVSGICILLIQHFFEKKSHSSAKIHTSDMWEWNSLILPDTDKRLVLYRWERINLFLSKILSVSEIRHHISEGSESKRTKSLLQWIIRTSQPLSLWFKIFLLAMMFIYFS